MRKSRELINGLSYHVTARANRQEFILQSDKIKEILLSVITSAKKKYKFKVKNICIMENHFHLIIKPLENESLSKIMQWILSVFAIRFNKIFGYIGHVWYDRFKSKIITSFKQYIRTFVYISNNPVKAELVSNSSDYDFNGIKFILNKDFRLVERPKAVVLDIIRNFL